MYLRPVVHQPRPGRKHCSAVDQAGVAVDTAPFEQASNSVPEFESQCHVLVRKAERRSSTSQRPTFSGQSKGEDVEELRERAPGGVKVGARGPVNNILKILKFRYLFTYL